MAEKRKGAEKEEENQHNGTEFVISPSLRRLVQFLPPGRLVQVLPPKILAKKTKCKEKVEQRDNRS